MTDYFILLLLFFFQKIDLLKEQVAIKIIYFKVFATI